MQISQLGEARLADMFRPLSQNVQHHTKGERWIVYVVFLCAVSGRSEEEEAQLQQRGSLRGGVGR